MKRDLSEMINERPSQLCTQLCTQRKKRKPEKIVADLFLVIMAPVGCFPVQDTTSMWFIYCVTQFPFGLLKF